MFREKALGERQLVGFLILADGSAAAIVLKVDPSAEGDQLKISRIMKLVDSAVARYQGPEAFYVTGDTPLIYYADLYMRRDLGFLFPIMVLLVLIILLLSFRSFRGMALPLTVVLLAVIWTVGLMALCGVKLTIASVFLPVLLVAVGSAYGIHVVNDYFERSVQGGGSRDELIIQVAEEMANPVFIAAITTAIGFVTLLSAFLQPIREFGLFSAAGVAFSFIISLTLIPAVLSLTSIPKAIQRRKEQGSFLERGAGFLAHVVSRQGVGSNTHRPGHIWSLSRPDSASSSRNRYIEVLPPRLPGNSRDEFRGGALRWQCSDERGGGHRSTRWPQRPTGLGIHGQVANPHGVAQTSREDIVAGEPRQRDKLYPA